MGNNIGVRLIDEYLSKTSFHQSPSPASSSSSSPPDFNNGVCRSLRETADSIAKVGFKMFLGVNVDVANFSDARGPGGAGGGQRRRGPPEAPDGVWRGRSRGRRGVVVGLVGEIHLHQLAERGGKKVKKEKKKKKKRKRKNSIVR